MDNLVKQHQWKGEGEGAWATRLMADADFEREFRPLIIGGRLRIRRRMG